MIQRGSFPISRLRAQGHWTQATRPRLKAWLGARFDDVEQMDLSVEAFDHFLTHSLGAPGTACAAGSRRFGSPTLLRRCARGAPPGARFGGRVVGRGRQARPVTDGGGARGKGAGFGIPTPRPAVRTLYHGLRLVSAAHYPSELTPHNFTMGYANDRSEEVRAATEDEEQNPFIAFYREEVLPRLVERRPKLLGLSVLYGSQLVPAMTLGRMVKEALPDCHVTMGGGFLAYIGDKVMDAQILADCFDSIIFHEGESPLEALAEALRSGEEDLAGVGSLAWWDRRPDFAASNGGPRAVRNTPAHPIKLDDAPAPSFDGLPLEKYFSPALVVPYDVNRGCYYGECTFCTLPTVIGPGYRTRSADTIARHVVELRDRYASTHFNFITDCMPPGMIQDLPEQLIEREAGITWWADARIEPKAYSEEGAKRLYESGCRKLLFGFESAVKRILKMMMKGQSLKSVVEVARNCTEADISVTFYAMVGFPTETREEARETLRFIEEHSDIVREVSLQTFHIDEVAKTYGPDSWASRFSPPPAIWRSTTKERGMTQRRSWRCSRR